MSKTKPKLSDVARQTNSARASKFASSMIPAPPIQRNESASGQGDSTSAEATIPVLDQPVVVVAQPTPETSHASDEEKSAISQVTQVNQPAETTVRNTRKRAGNLSLEEIISNKAPDGENFGKMTRIAEKHHDLLREIAFKHRKNMNTILYNLLELLDQTYQREQQNHA